MAYNPNPQLVSAIIRHARPGDRAITLATSLVESGGQLDAVGDNGQSFGPYQEYTGGRGAGIAPAQRQDPVASTQRFLKELSAFRARGFTGGELAYRTQRPADHTGYVQKINAALPIAKQILASQGAGGAGARPAGGGAPAAEGMTPQGNITLTPRTQKAVRNYIVKSEKDALAGRMPGDITGIVGMIQQDKARSVQSAPAQVARQSSATPSQYRAAPGSFGGFSMGGGPDAHHSRAIGNWQSDDAYDLMGKAGDPVPAFVSGTVTKVSGQPGGDPGFAGYGITVRTSNGVDLFYKHLGTANVKVGQRIAPQTILGTLDPTTAGGPHLHLGGTNRGFLDQLAKRYSR